MFSRTIVGKKEEVGSLSSCGIDYSTEGVERPVVASRVVGSATIQRYYSRNKGVEERTNRLSGERKHLAGL
jgi:hypothetical protein